MLSLMNIAFDSSDLILFIDASRGGCQFSSHACVREAANATFRLFLYCRPFIVRTVMAEAERIIKEDANLRLHMLSISSMLAECRPDDGQILKIERRAAELARFHVGQMDEFIQVGERERRHVAEMNDCRILAEVEMCKVPMFVTWDWKLKRHLSPHTTVRIQEPVECWQSLEVPPGTEPQWSPAPGNPLAKETWWQW